MAVADDKVVVPEECAVAKVTSSVVEPSPLTQLTLICGMIVCEEDPSVPG